MLGKVSDLCTPHPLYLALGSEVKQRQANYSELFKCQIVDQSLADIRSKTNEGMALGSTKFAIEIEDLTGRRMTAKKTGRSIGSNKKEKTLP